MIDYSTAILENHISDFKNKKISSTLFSNKVLQFLNDLLGNKDRQLNVKYVENTKEPFFGVRVFPSMNDLMTISSKLYNNINDRNEFLNYRVIEWNIEIDSKLMFTDNALISPFEICSLILFTVFNKILDIATMELIYDSFINNYVKDNIYAVKVQSKLNILYTYPILNAFICKNWIYMKDNKNDIYSILLDNYKKNNDNFNDSINETIKDSELDILHEGILSCIGKIISIYGNTDINKTEVENHHYISALMLDAGRYATDYVKRKDHLRDDLLSKSLQTDSELIKKYLFFILNYLGVELYERYTGAILESTTFDILSDKNIFKNYSLKYNNNSIMNNLYNQAQTAIDYAMESIFPKSKVKLPSDKEIDLIFVEIDKMENQFDRRYVLDKIYNIINQITLFKNTYSDDLSIIKKYENIIDTQINRLNNARNEVLNKRTFNKKYKVFIDVPEEYEG